MLVVVAVCVFFVSSGRIVISGGRFYVFDSRRENLKKKSDHLKGAFTHPIIWFLSICTYLTILQC